MAAETGSPLWVALAWGEAHAVVPDGPKREQPFRLYGFQGKYMTNYYRVRPAARPEQNGSAFTFRRGLLIGVQGIGKNPLIAFQCCLEGVGPALYAGRAGIDEGYACAGHGCGCGFEYAYEPGEPMGRQWTTPLIQITGFSEDSTDNTWDLLKPMIELGPLSDVIPKTGEQFIRLPGGGRIDIVTSSDRSRLGNRPTFVPQDELGLWDGPSGMIRLAHTQWRNLTKRDGRSSGTSNAWDPTRDSVAREEYESKATDIYRQFTQPPKNLSFGNKRERSKIFAIVYDADIRLPAGHVEMAAIEAEAAEAFERNSAEAERFYGNILAEGAGKAFDLERFIALRRKTPYTVPDGALITLGFDGSRRHDHTALIGTEVASGYQWPLGIWRAEQHKGQIPAGLVNDIVEGAFGTWDVWRLYADPPYWEDTIAGWAGTYGDERVVEWWTNKRRSMAYAIRSWQEAQLTGAMSHCAERHPYDALFTEHVGNAVRAETGYRDDGGPLFLVEKPHPLLKIDSVPAAVLSWEARNDAITAGALRLADPAEVLVEWD